ncbi:MAG: thioredoxin family protein [Spirochaetes bacterium]|nr:thioredoxin family protein [Spirochaetota bacterium]MCK5268541.1 thioredoxin family protein [Spirochaetota bacterium]
MIKKMLFITLIFFLISCDSKTKGAQGSAGKQSQKKPVKQYQVTLVELGSVRCVPCRMMTPVLETVKKKYGAKVNIIFYNVWKSKNRKYARKYRVRVIPTQVFLDKDGVEYFRHEGFFPLDKVEEIIKKKF